MDSVISLPGGEPRILLLVVLMLWVRIPVYTRTEFLFLKWRQLSRAPTNHEARERSEPFFPWFSKEKKAFS